MGRDCAIIGCSSIRGLWEGRFGGGGKCPILSFPPGFEPKDRRTGIRGMRLS